MTYIYIYICIHMYRERYTYNPHLGLIKAPPLVLFFLQTTFSTIHLL